ncbi:hypothetical protein CEXT_89381 [Caerostris extrusa]|uniref:Uncharacterized protein n=1 Tax=Caerostris extrusa TaxID=172846 RepID=A0AAV4UH98_CAEEX|nr:hypothetical protein CEXT_89381 [Caerostris extrusa]
MFTKKTSSNNNKRTERKHSFSSIPLNPALIPFIKFANDLVPLPSHENDCSKSEPPRTPEAELDRQSRSLETRHINLD